MIISSLKCQVFLASFLLSTVSPVFMVTSWSMIQEEKNTLIVEQKQSRPCLSVALNAFEAGNRDEEAMQMFVQLSQAGAIIPEKYLEYFKVKIDSSFSSESIPEDGLVLSKQFFDASMNYRDYQQKKNKSFIEKLGLQILNGNIHALSLMKKLECEGVKIFDLLPKKGGFKKIKSFKDFLNNFSYKCNMTSLFWKCLDLNIIPDLYKSINPLEFKKVINNLEIHSNNIGECALEMVTSSPTDAWLWAHLAVENGTNEGCATLLDCYFTSWFRKTISTNDKKTARCFFRYYVSKIKGSAARIRDFGLCLSEIKDQAEARNCFKIAADQGDPRAQSKYGCMLHKGEGGEKNLAEARKYSKLAADQKIVAAQCNYGIMLYKGEGGKQDLEEAHKYFQLAAFEGYSDALIMLHKMEVMQNQANIQKDLNDQDKSQAPEEQNTATDVEITLAALEERVDSSEEEEFPYSPVLIAEPKPPVFQQDGQLETIEVKVKQIHLELKEMPTEGKKAVEETETEEKKLAKELSAYDQKNKLQWSADRSKKQLVKQAKKEAAARTRQTLIVNKKDYEETCKKFEPKMEMCEQKMKTGILFETMEFVKAIFGQGKINTFSNTDAKKAFTDLGCVVGNKKGENSTLLAFSTTSLSFDLEGNRRMALNYQELNNEDMRDEKVKYHNPHGHGDDNLYNALKPHLKRFLASINKTPETLQVK